MLTTFTNASAGMATNYDLDGALNVLSDDGLLLIPTDTLWSIACDARNPVALNRLRRLRPPRPGQPIEVLFADMRMLKKYTRRIHPRLETLLAHHDRPLTVLLEHGYGLPDQVTDNRYRLAVRLVRDGYCQALIRSLQSPLATIYACPDGAPIPTTFGRVRSDVIRSVDYISPVGRSDRASGAASVMVQLRKDEELDFLRE